MNAPAFIPVDTAEPRSFAEIIADLSADHERFVAAIGGFRQQLEAHAERVDAACEAFREHQRRFGALACAPALAVMEN